MNFQKIIDNKIVNFNIELSEETSGAIISYLIPNSDYEIDFIICTIISLTNFVNQYDLLQKPIIKLHMPNYFAGKLLDEISSRIPNSTKKIFNKLQIIDAYRIFEYNGWKWKLIFTF